MAIVYGFAGMTDVGGEIGFDPRLPAEWDSVRFKVQVRGTTLHVDLDHSRLALRTDEGKLDVTVRGESVTVTPEGVAIPL